MKLRVQQVRKGFAYNSSSSHSIVFLKEGDGDILHDDSNYGWEQFLLVSKNEKAKYLAAQMHHALASSIGPEGATVVVAGFFGVDGDRGIDHQSVMSLPRLHDGTLAIEFIKDAFNSFIDNDKIGIAGGNDNGGDEIHEGRPSVNFGSTYDIPIARKEADGTWITFSRHGGTKVRYTPDFLGEVRNKKASTPELVDIKITDYCTYGCSFCYQGSTPKGNHCTLEDYKKLIDKLAELKVFEVAIGGGEPTQHPDFIEMIKYTRSKGIVPNVTTRSVEWFVENVDSLRDKDHYDLIGKHAVSIDNYEDLRDKLAYVLKAQKTRQGVASPVFQVIAGVTPQEDFEKIAALKEKHWFDLSLVGFKRTGRAGNPLPLDGVKLYETLSKRFRDVSVDVTFLQQFPNFNQTLTCDTEEGRQSMYVDLAAKTMAKSSYSDEEVPLDLEKLNDYFLSL